MSLKKILYIVVILAIIIVSLSVAYYLIIYIPDRDNKNINLQQQEKEELQKQTEQEKNEILLNQFREECVTEKEKADDKFQEMLNLCSTTECAQNLANSPFNPTQNYISNCIIRKQNEIQ